MTLYVDANYTVDDADYFIDAATTGLYWDCDFVEYDGVLEYVLGDSACSISISAPARIGYSEGERQRTRNRKSRLRELLDDDDEVVMRVIKSFMEGIA